MRKSTARFLPVFLILLLLNSFFYAGNAAAQDQKTFMWKVQSKTAIVYVLGSVHFMKKEVYPLNNKIEDAFEKSNILAVEANINDAAKLDLQKLLTSAFYPGNETLEKHVSKETYELVKKETGSMGMPLELINKQKPWFLAMTLESIELMKLGFNPQYGIDNHFLKKATGKKKIMELESLDYQINLLSGFSDEEQELFLLHTLKDLKILKQEIDKLLQAWLTGDAKGIEAIASRVNGDRRIARIYEKLYYERNANMTSKIEEFLKTKETYFVVVGSGHLVGNKGIIELLKRKGYLVEQI
ncbi:MAG: TraB/GumN family protein [Nitrospirota bacterium]